MTPEPAETWGTTNANARRSPTADTATLPAAAARHPCAYPPPMTELRLLRHAHAGDPEKWSGPDAQRPLSEKGKRQADRLGTLLAALDDRPDLFITSPKLRAVQTGEGTAAALKAKVVGDDRLGGPRDLATIDAIVRDAG